MLKVAARFGVSSSYMARVCSLLSVPRPEHGYWAKVAVGKAPKQPALPEARPGDPLAWVRDGVQPKRARPSPRPPERKPRRKRTAREPLPDGHPLVNGAEPLFVDGRLSGAPTRLSDSSHAGRQRSDEIVQNPAIESRKLI